MSKFNFKNQTPPGTPETGQTFVYVDSVQKVLSTKDDTGAVVNYGVGGGGVTGAASGVFLNGANVQLGSNAGANPLLANTDIDIAAFTFELLSGANKHFFVDPVNGLYQFGDVSGVINFNYIQIDSNLSQMSVPIPSILLGNANCFLDIEANTNKLEFILTANKYFSCDIANTLYQIGDINSVNNGTFFSINDTRKGYNFNAVQTFADNAAALLGGLLAGDIYRITASDNLAIVH